MERPAHRCLCRACSCSFWGTDLKSWALGEADADLGAKLAQAENLGDMPGRLRPCPPLWQLVLPERMRNGRGCDGAGQATAPNGQRGQYRQVCDLAGPVAVSSGSGDLAVLADRECRR